VRTHTRTHTAAGTTNRHPHDNIQRERVREHVFKRGHTENVNRKGQEKRAGEVGRECVRERLAENACGRDWQRMLSLSLSLSLAISLSPF